MKHCETFGKYSVYIYLLFFAAIANVGWVHLLKSDVAESMIVETHASKTRIEFIKHSPETNTFENEFSCLDPKGSQPVVLLSLGRSGSSSTWQILGNLTGKETKKEEIPGKNANATSQFFKHHKDEVNHGRWVERALCKQQQLHDSAGFIGFMWKPFETTVRLPEFEESIRFLASMRNPRVKVIRTRRNLLDVWISRQKHNSAKLSGNKIGGHCESGNDECILRHLNTTRNMELPTNQLLRWIDKMTKSEDTVDAMLDAYNVKHVHVSYDNIFKNGANTRGKEIAMVLEFLRFDSNQTALASLEELMGHASTSTPRESLVQYEEIKSVLFGTKYSDLLEY